MTISRYVQLAYGVHDGRRGPRVEIEAFDASNRLTTAAARVHVADRLAVASPGRSPHLSARLVVGNRASRAASVYRGDVDGGGGHGSPSGDVGQLVLRIDDPGSISRGSGGEDHPR